MKKVKIKSSPVQMSEGGGVFMNYPWAGALSPNHFGNIESDTSNLDASYNDSIKPIDKEDANIEAEKGETLLKEDGSGIFKILGKKHSKGGSPLKVAPGSFIISDNKDLKITKEEAEIMDLKGVTDKSKNNTPSKVLQKNIDYTKYNKFMSVINDPKANAMDKKTAALMLEKYLETIGKVSYLQEEKKGFPQGLPPQSEGTAPVYQDDVSASMVQSEQFMNGGMVELMKAAYGFLKPMDVTKMDDDLTVHTGDKNPPAKVSPSGKPFPNNTNASLLTQDEIDKYAKQVGFKIKKGVNQNKEFQKYLYDNFKDVQYIVDANHSEYGMPKNGMFDGNFGVRWTDAIRRGLNPNQSTGRFKRGSVSKDHDPMEDANTLSGVEVKSTPKERTVPEPGRNPLKDVPLQRINDKGIGINSLEALSIAQPALQALSTPTYYDILQQKHTPDVRLDRINNTDELNRIQETNQSRTRELFANMDPRLAAAAAAMGLGQTNSAMMTSNANVNNANTQIGMQESMTNYNADVADMNYNLAEIGSTYDRNVVAQQNAGDLRRKGIAQSQANMLGVSQNLERLKNQIMTMSMPYMTQAYYDKSGRYLGQDSDFTDPSTGVTVIPEDIRSRISFKRNVSPIALDENRNPYSTGFGSLASVTNNQAQIGQQTMQMLNTILSDPSADIRNKLDAAKIVAMMSRPAIGQNSPMDELMSSQLLRTMALTGMGNPMTN